MERERRSSGGPNEIKIKMPDGLLAGRYANVMGVQHSASEFVMDFAFVAGGVGEVVARVVTSPGHMKRIVAALQENMSRYEHTYGKVKETGESQVRLGFQPKDES